MTERDKKQLSVIAKAILKHNAIRDPEELIEIACNVLIQLDTLSGTEKRINR